MNIQTLGWHKFIFRLTLVISILVSVVMALIEAMSTMDHLSSYSNPSVTLFDTITITNPTTGFLVTLLFGSLWIFIITFIPARILYFAIRWVYNGLVNRN